MIAVDNGAPPGPHAQHDRAHIVIYIFLSIALYNVLELVVQIATTFKRCRGLYCWSFLVATCGIALDAVGYLLRAMDAAPSPYMYATLTAVGWCIMITGQSLVLYSRLHIVLHWEKLLRGILIMIMVNAVWLSVPVIVLVYLSDSPKPGAYIHPYLIFEKIQLTVFFVQETIISGLYVTETYKILRSYRGLASGGTRKTMTYLILTNSVIIVLDISIVYLQFADHYNLQTAWKPLVYSIKLKLEFGVLNRLVELSQHVRRNRGLALVDTLPVDAAGLPLDMVAEDGTEVGRSFNDTASYSRYLPSVKHKSNVSNSEVGMSPAGPCEC